MPCPCPCLPVPAPSLLPLSLAGRRALPTAAAGQRASRRSAPGVGSVPGREQGREWGREQEEPGLAKAVGCLSHRPRQGSPPDAAERRAEWWEPEPGLCRDGAMLFELCCCCCCGRGGRWPTRAGTPAWGDAVVASLWDRRPPWEAPSRHSSARLQPSPCMSRGAVAGPHERHRGWGAVGRGVGRGARGAGAGSPCSSPGWGGRCRGDPPADVPRAPLCTGTLWVPPCRGWPCSPHARGAGGGGGGLRG